MNTRPNPHYSVNDECNQKIINVYVQVYEFPNEKGELDRTCGVEIDRLKRRYTLEKAFSKFLIMYREKLIYKPMTDDYDYVDNLKKILFLASGPLFFYREQE